MPALLISLDSKISSPLPGNPILQLSDNTLIKYDFKTNGDLSGQKISDKFEWAGTPEAIFVDNGTANVNAKVNYFVGVNAGVNDAIISFTLAKGPMSTNTVSQFFDFRRTAIAIANFPDCYRLSMFSTAVGTTEATVVKRIKNVISEISPKFAIRDGDSITIKIIGQSIQVAVNNMSTVNITDSSISFGSCYGFSGALNENQTKYSSFSLKLP